jgi:hypothetical protein
MEKSKLTETKKGERGGIRNYTCLQQYADVTTYTKGRGIDLWAATLITMLESAVRLKSVTSARGYAYLRRGAGGQ